jgi:hypothetical protein
MKASGHVKYYVKILTLGHKIKMDNYPPTSGIENQKYGRRDLGHNTKMDNYPPTSGIEKREYGCRDPS